MSRQRQREIVPRRRWLFPMGVEREYVRFAKRLAAALRESVKEELPRLRDIQKIKQDGAREDIYMLMQSIRSRFKSKVEQLRVDAELRRIAKLAGDFNMRQFRAVLRSAMKVDIFVHEPWLSDLVNVWVSENVRLISTVPETVFSDIEGIAARGVMEGTSTADLADDILERVDIGERKAQLIARDQVGKLNGDITQHRQTQVGIESYIWSTSKDSRVRPKHAYREGVRFRWDNPPPDGHPGKPIHCRCCALPIIDLDRIQYMEMPMPGRR